MMKRVTSYFGGLVAILILAGCSETQLLKANCALDGQRGYERSYECQQLLDQEVEEKARKRDLREVEKQERAREAAKATWLARAQAAFDRGDDSTAVKWWMAVARGGENPFDDIPAMENDKVAQAKLGYMYLTGRGVAQSDQEAVRWYTKSALQYYAPAESSLGHMYYNGLGVDKDLATALVWTRRAAEAGNAQGQNNLGVMYVHGDAVPKDIQAAIGWYRKAAAQGHEGARKSLAKHGATP